jgi:t-SNARE complex subunit (syntaxin)
MSEKADQPIVSGTPVKPKKRHTCARHCKRFWWIYLIVAILIIVLVVCLM